MPFFVLPLTVGANSSNQASFSGIAGEIYRAGLYFPLNAGGVLFVSVRIGNLIFPTPVAGGSSELNADNFFVELPFPEPYSISAGEEIVIYGRNTDALYPHTVYLWLWVR